jgi:hypothetical protein
MRVWRTTSGGWESGGSRLEIENNGDLRRVQLLFYYAGALLAADGGFVRLVGRSVVLFASPSSLGSQ